MTLRIMLINIMTVTILTLSITVKNGYADCRSGECHYAECRGAKKINGKIVHPGETDGDGVEVGGVGGLRAVGIE
jgi:hypothetical protein